MRSTPFSDLPSYLYNFPIEDFLGFNQGLESHDYIK